LSSLAKQNKKQSKVSLRCGDRVALFPPLGHLDPSAFQDPRTFKHDRFLGPKGKELAKTGQSVLIAVDIISGVHGGIGAVAGSDVVVGW
jgi:cytochrome P450